MQIQASAFPDLQILRDDNGGFHGLLTSAGIEACTEDTRFLCGRRVLSSFRDMRLDVGRMIMEKLPLDYPRGYFVSVDENDLAVFLSETCSAGAMEDFLNKKQEQTEAEIAAWLRERSWDTNPIESAALKGLNFLFDPERGELNTDGGVNAIRFLETPSSVDGVRVRSVGSYGLAAYRNLKELIFSDSLVALSDYLVYGFMELERVKISANVTTIPAGTFGRCKMLKQVALPYGLLAIGRDAFFNDVSIDRLIIPDTVRKVGSCAFVGVRRLTYHGDAPGYPWGASNVIGKIMY